MWNQWSTVDRNIFISDMALSPMAKLQSVQKNSRCSIWTTFVWVNYICSTNQWLRFLLQHIRDIGNKQAWWTSTTLKYRWFPCKLKLYGWKGNNYSGEIFGSLPAYFSYSDTKQGCQGNLELHLQLFFDAVCLGISKYCLRVGLGILGWWWKRWSLVVLQIGRWKSFNFPI